MPAAEKEEEKSLKRMEAAQAEFDKIDGRLQRLKAELIKVEAAREAAEAELSAASAAHEGALVAADERKRREKRWHPPCDAPSRSRALNEPDESPLARCWELCESLPLPPASSRAPCTPGDHAWDEAYEYRCVAPDRWKRATLSDW